MTVAVVSLLVYALEGYVLVGLLFSLMFVSVGISRLDPAAKGSALSFRLIILPGVVALWPVLLHRWIKARVA